MSIGDTIKSVIITVLINGVGLILSRELVASLVNTQGTYGLTDLYLLGTGLFFGTFFIVMIAILTNNLGGAARWILTYSAGSWIFLSATIVAASFIEGRTFSFVLPLCGVALPLMIGVVVAMFYEEA